MNNKMKQGGASEPAKDVDMSAAEESLTEEKRINAAMAVGGLASLAIGAVGAVNTMSLFGAVPVIEKFVANSNAANIVAYGADKLATAANLVQMSQVVGSISAATLGAGLLYAAWNARESLDAKRIKDEIARDAKSVAHVVSEGWSSVSKAVTATVVAASVAVGSAATSIMMGEAAMLGVDGISSVSGNANVAHVLGGFAGTPLFGFLAVCGVAATVECLYGIRSAMKKADGKARKSGGQKVDPEPGESGKLGAEPKVLNLKGYREKKESSAVVAKDVAVVSEQAAKAPKMA